MRARARYIPLALKVIAVLGLSSLETSVEELPARS